MANVAVCKELLEPLLSLIIFDAPDLFDPELFMPTDPPVPDTEKRDKPFSYLQNSKSRAEASFEEIKELSDLIVQGNLDEDPVITERIKPLVAEAYKLARDLKEKLDAAQLIVKRAPSTMLDPGGVQQVEGDGVQEYQEQAGEDTPPASTAQEHGSGEPDEG